MNPSGTGVSHSTTLLRTGAVNSRPQCFSQAFTMSCPCKSHYMQQGKVPLEVYVDVIFFKSNIVFKSLSGLCVK